MHDAHEKIQNWLSDESRKWNGEEKYWQTFGTVIVDLKVLIDDKRQRTQGH